MSIRNFGSRLPLVYDHSWWSRHGIGPILQNCGVPGTGISQGCPGVSRVHELLPEIHPEICQGDPSTDGITKETRHTPEWQERDISSHMVMDAASRRGIPGTESELSRTTGHAACRFCKADDSPNGREWMCDCRNPHPVQCFRGSQTSQFLLPEVLFNRTELRHL